MPVPTSHSISKTILHENINCFQMSFSMIKACHKRSLQVLLLFNLGIVEMKHKCTTLPSTDLAWIFDYFCVKLFVLFSSIKKESRLILGNFPII